MDARSGRANISGGSTTTNGNARTNTRRNLGQAQDGNVGTGAPQVDMGVMYQFFVNMIQVGAAVVLVGGN